MYKFLLSILLSTLVTPSFATELIIINKSSHTVNRVHSDGARADMNLPPGYTGSTGLDMNPNSCFHVISAESNDGTLWGPLQVNVCGSANYKFTLF